jgi:hypothetical protein
MKDTIEIGGEFYDNAIVLCERFGLHINTIAKWKKRGLLPGATKIGKVWYYPRTQVDARLANGE